MPVEISSFHTLLERARSLVHPGGRAMLGIAGAPGSGKSTLAARLVGELGDLASLVPMDGFHLANAQLERLGRLERKGAIDTFDGAGYVSLLSRLREGETASVVYAPEFHREIEESYAGAIAVEPRTPLVVTEGNYLLVDEGPWARVRPLLDESWFCALDDEVRIARLVARHRAYGRGVEESRSRALGSDERNARLVAASRHRADVVVRLDS